MNNILSMDGFLFENENSFNFIQDDFSNNQIIESIKYLNSDDDQLLEAWYNTILDFAALIPVVGSVAEGINLVSYSKQGEFLLAGLCAIGLIPLFGQYIGAGGTLLVKALRNGSKLGAGILKPLLNGVAKFFPKIVKFLKSPKFLSKFSGISPFVGKIIASLKSFVLNGGSKLVALSKNKGLMKELKVGALKLKTGVKVVKAVTGTSNNKIQTTQPSYAGYGSKSQQQDQMPVPKEAYMNYQGIPLKNIRPYTDTEISQAEMAQNWDLYL